MGAWGAVATAALLVPLLTACSPPIVFVVTTTDDGVDADPGDGICATTGGDCTLRAAVQEANAASGPVRIELSAGHVYLLSIPGLREDGSATGDLDTWADNLTVEGHGSGIDASAGSTVPLRSRDRVWDHHAGRLDLNELVLGNGRADDGGGGVRVAAGVVRITDSAVVGNTVWGGDHVDPRGIGIELLDGVLTIWSSAIRANTQTEDHDGVSAAIYQAGGSLVLYQAEVSENYSWSSTSSTGPGFHAGIYQEAGYALISTSRIADNRRSLNGIDWYGDGIHAEGTLDVFLSLISGNTTDVSGNGSIRLGGDRVQRCSASAATSIGYNRYDTLACTADPTDSSDYSAVIDQIPVGTPTLCDASTPPDVDDQPRPVGPACDVGYHELG
jgi:CSLREA domain-containing protein